MAKKKAQATHGGARKGSGRKKDPNAKKTTTVAMTPDVLEFLASTGNRSQAIEDIVRRSKAFREWEASR